VQLLVFFIFGLRARGNRDIIHANQFGGRAHSSCLDAGLALIHDIQDAHKRGLKVGILLFDVWGFFDNVNHGRMTAILENLGYPPELVRWSKAFLKDRKVRLSFNNVIAEERGQPIGVLQGSPLSPVYSITYTSSLLAKMKEWNNSSLGMYVDDGILFAASEEWGDVERLLRARYTVCEEWLRRSGLAIEPDKTELLFFQKPYERNAVQAPTRLVLPDPTISSYYVVRPVENLRYLGFFINRRLKWEPHVWIMCNRARASIKALQVLGNTVRGLSMANWKLVLNAVCLPVLTYGSQLWYLTGAAKGLLNMVQRVQNDMVRQVTGAFRTAPREPLLHFTRMMPMKFFIEKLTYTSALRLYRLPRESQLLRRLGTDWYSPGQGDLPLLVPRSRVLPGKRNQRPTALEALALKVPSEGPKVDVAAIAPWEVPNWVEHVSYMGVENPYVRKAWIRDLTAAVTGTNTMLIHLAAATRNREAEGLGVVGGAAATYSRGGAEVTSHDWVIGSDLTQFDADAYVLARAAEVMAQCYTAEVAPPSHTYIFCASSPGRKTRRPLFMRRTTSTTLQLAVDHAFTGSYARRFRPNDPPQSLRCPCGFHLRNPDHLIRHCRHFYLHRLSNHIISRGIILSLKTLFSHSVEHSHRLLSFIQQSRAAMRPPEMEARPPPEPD
jgi:hypothetical protein